MKRVLFIAIMFVTSELWAVIPASGNGIVIADISGATQSKSPETVSRFFKPGEIPHYAQAVIAGQTVLTQCDVKNRWPDGSVKFALVSFVIPTITSGGTLVTFQNQSTGNNTGALTSAGMLNAAYNFDAAMTVSGKAMHTVDARAMLTANKFSYWLQGPIVTAVIIEDRATRSST